MSARAEQAWELQDRALCPCRTKIRNLPASIQNRWPGGSQRATRRRTFSFVPRLQICQKAAVSHRATVQTPGLDELRRRCCNLRAAITIRRTNQLAGWLGGSGVDRFMLPTEWATPASTMTRTTPVMCVVLRMRCGPSGVRFTFHSTRTHDHCNTAPRTYAERPRPARTRPAQAVADQSADRLRRAGHEAEGQHALLRLHGAGDHRRT